MSYEYKIKWCPICKQGWIIIVKEKISENLFLYCTECESEWIDPQEINTINATRECFGFIVNPDIEEIKNKGWEKYILKA
ncbi:hypothetical protein AGMMS50239_37250 [Bacteroidia bacterium]|nr:hypothetical protein AGMMS50239_37250 [Bacteroidia bacterium]